jgi:hypothetical protein
LARRPGADGRGGLRGGQRGGQALGAARGGGNVVPGRKYTGRTGDGEVST